MNKTEQHGCAGCRTRGSDALEKLSVERNEYVDGRAYETLTHYRCRLCGAKWLHIVEGGAGGRGDFWYPE